MDSAPAKSKQTAFFDGNKEMEKKVNAVAAELPPLEAFEGSDQCCPPELQGYRQTFREKGFVVVPGLLQPDEMVQFEADVAAAVQARKESYTLGMPVTERTTYERQFTQCINLWEDNPAVRHLTFHPKVVGAAAALLGVPALRIWHDQALFKPAGGSATTAHNDQPFWPIAEPRTITAWVVLSETGSTFQNGALGYLPGTHRSGVRHLSDIVSGDEEDHRARDEAFLNQPELRGIDPEFVEVPRGSVAFHHGLTVHMAKPNVSDLPRNVHCGIYFADGCTRGSILGLRNQTHPMVDRPGAVVQKGKPIDSPLTPIAFPLADSQLPSTPPSLTQQDFENFKGTMPRPTAQAKM